MRRGFTAGVAICAIFAVGLAPATSSAADPDRDGLSTKIEKGKGKKGKKAKLRKLGAKPRHKDVFVELNYSNATGPGEVKCSALNDLVAVFKGAPVSNPDGNKGINLHIDAGKTCGSKDYDHGGSSRGVAVPGGCANPSTFGNALATKRLRYWRNGGVVSTAQLCGAEGIATESDFVVRISDGAWGFAHVVMHELGHIFGLDHGQFNSFSVMSGGLYRAQPGLVQEIDYTRYPIQALDESALVEGDGYSTGSTAGDNYISQFYGPHYCGTTLTLVGSANGPIDFDCDGSPFYMPPYSQYIDGGTVSYDVNNDSVIGTVPAVAPEWPTVGSSLRNGRIGG